MPTNQAAWLRAKNVGLDVGPAIRIGENLGTLLAAQRNDVSLRKIVVTL